MCVISFLSQLNALLITILPLKRALKEWFQYNAIITWVGLSVKDIQVKPGPFIENLQRLPHPGFPGFQTLCLSFPCLLPVWQYCLPSRPQPVPFWISSPSLSLGVGSSYPLAVEIGWQMKTCWHLFPWERWIRESVQISSTLHTASSCLPSSPSLCLTWCVCRSPNVAFLCKNQGF